MRNKVFAVASLLIIASMVLAACATPTAQPSAPQVTEVVKKIRRPRLGKGKKEPVKTGKKNGPKS